MEGEDGSRREGQEEKHVGDPAGGAPPLQDQEVRHEDGQQDGAEDYGVHVPGGSEEEGHLGDAPGLEEHEPGP